MKSFKRICMTLIIMMLSVAMVLGTMSISAFALSAGDAPATLVEKVNIVSKVKYGTLFTVPAASTGATVKVTAPNGKTVATAAGAVTADQVGTYVVSYSNGDYSYDFDVLSYIEKDYEIVVANGGADIPTYFNAGDDLTFPAAKLVYYDEDGVAQEVSSKIEVLTSMSADAVAADGTGKIKTTAGNLYVTYSARFGGEGAAKYFTKEFLVKVQDGFTDTTNPTLSVVNVPQNASLNRKMTLPSAKATDNYDENVKVVVEVKHDNEDVKEVELDQNGYAKKELTNKVVFDNGKNMSFYPTKTGKYVVTYKAVDDKGNESALHTYPVTVSDTSAPAFDSIADWQIPASWGLSVNGAGSSEITFPTPVLVDNDMYDADGKSKLTLEFKVTDPDGNTVITYSNILAAAGEDGSTFKGKASQYGVDGTNYPFGKFDFSLVGTSETKTGNYTVEYIARDAARNRSTRTFTINVAESYTDEDAPNACEIIDAPDYLVLSEDVETFEVPAIEATDAADSRPHVEYTLSVGDSSLEVKGGEVLDVEMTTEGTITKFFLVDSDDNKLEVTGGDELKLNLTITDNCGNTKSAETETVKVFSSASANTAMTLIPDLNLTETFKTGEEANLGKFEVGVGNDDDYRKFTGYELSIKNTEDDGYATKVTSDYYYDTEAHKLVVKDINFVPTVAGTYQISMRAFDLSGQNIVKIALFTVTQGAGGSTSTTAAKLTPNGTVNASYSFKNEKFDVELKDGETAEDTKYFAVYRIEGSRHAVMGTEFTAKTAGSYRIDEGYAKYDGGNVAAMTKVDHTDVTFTDSEAPVIEVQGVVPTYSKKSTTAEPVKVTLPSVIARTANGSAPLAKRSANDSDIVVRMSAGGTVTTEYDAETNTFSFEPKKDGVYRIIMTGTVNGASNTVEYTMNVGDIVGPKLEVTAPNSREIVGNTFKFATVKATADAGEDITKFTFTKRLLDPSGSEVSEATITGQGNTYADKVENDADNPVKFTKSGDYTVEYEVTDENGNTTTRNFKVTVSSKTGATSVSIAAISTVLIVVGVVLIIAVILYFVLFRKRKAKN